jgi:hypothetical protein
MPESKAPNDTTAPLTPQATPPRKTSVVRILWNFKDYVVGAVGVYELIKKIIENGDSELRFAVIFYVTSYSVGKIVWSIIQGTMLIFIVIFGGMRIVRLFVYLFMSSSKYAKISAVIENTGIWPLWVAMATGALFGIISLLELEPTEDSSLVYAWMGALILLTTFYSVCQLIHKKVKMLTADGNDT